MTREKPLYVVIYDVGWKREMSRRVPVTMNGGVAGHMRSLAAPIAVRIERPGWGEVRLYDAPVGGNRIPFSVRSPLPAGLEAGDIVHVS